MAAKKDIYELVNELIDAIDLTCTIESVTDNLDGTYTFETCDTLHMQPAISNNGYTVTINGNEYTVLDVVNNTSVTVSGSVLPPVGTFQVYAPFFYHGTILATKSELDNEPNHKEKYPLVYLLERIQEKFIADEESAIEREVNLRMFFLANSDPEQWSTDDHYAKVIKPMKNLAEKFVDACKAASNIESIGDYTVISHVKFGEYVEKGTIKKIFSESSGGVELQIPISFLKPVCSNC